jgi:choline dehydrogenase-like flavoprotein
MIPFQLADMRAWPVSPGEITAYQSEVEALFQLASGPYDQPEIVSRTDCLPSSHVARFAKWPSFARRNVAKLLGGDIQRTNGPEIWLNATATKFDLAPNGKLESVSASAPNGAQLTVRAPETVLAAGAIESTRLLLLADRQHEDRIFAPDGILGRYFHDHLSVPVGKVQPTNRLALNRFAGFRFEGDGMCNLRFEPVGAAAIRTTIPAGFVHIAFSNEDGSGFDAVRSLYRQLQKGRPPDTATLFRLAKAMPWLAKAVWWRYREHRLLYPSRAEIELHMVIEQIPRPCNRVTLSTDRTDCYGQPLAAIDWAVSREDEENLTRSTDLFVDLWQHSTLAQLGTILRRASGEAEKALAKGGGVYHPSGSTRMGLTPAEGVVDRNLRTFRVPNLSVVSTSTFPSAGGANPTMMLMMATLRLADHILKKRQNRPRDENLVSG